MKYSIANNTLLSGRADGNVYFRNHVIRGFAMPANPNTAAQTTQRGNFGSLSGNWNSLTDAQRASWLALTVNVTDRLGHNVALSGKELYVALNRNLFNSGNAALTTAPTPASPLSPASLSISNAQAGGVEITYTATPIPAGTTYLVFATAQQTAGTYKPSLSKYKLIAVLPAATASPQDITTEYENRFGQLSAGGSVFVRVIAIKNSTGFAAPAVSARAVTT